MVEINTEQKEGFQLIRVSGDVDASSSIMLDNEINNVVQEGHKKILFDCEGLNYISSAGLGVFMSYIQVFEASNTKVAIYGLSEKVVNVFQILGLDQLLRIEATHEKAKEYIDEL